MTYGDTTYAQLSQWGNSRIIVVADDTEDERLHIPASRIVAWRVDWTVKSGRLSIFLEHGRTVTVEFDQDDGGAECAAAGELLTRLVEERGV
jgi:hypothetical protein